MHRESGQRKPPGLAFAAVLTLAAIFGLVMLGCVLRGADTVYRYPEYSSLNNGDNGTKAYFEALGRLGFSPSRNFKMLRKLEGARAAILYAGVELWSFRYSDEKQLEAFEQLAEGGARVVIALDPEGVIEAQPENGRARPESKGPQAPDDNLKKRWGVEVAPIEHPGASRNREFLVRLGVLPVTWRFALWPAAWTPTHVRDGSPLFLERTFGKGNIVLVANSKLFTNRELLIHGHSRGPDVEALAWTPGGYRDVIFDESHLGVADTGSVMGLARAHGLGWMLVGFVVLGISYVWRSAVSFVPPVAAPEEARASGRDAHLALSHLLMQSVALRSILRVAGEEWNRSAALRAPATVRPLSQEELNRLEHVTLDDAAAEYRSLAGRLNRTVWKRAGRGRADQAK
jgi:hypothetical protein